MATVETTQKQRRHQKTAKDFKRWLAKNPDVSLTRKIGAFNAIADSNCRLIKQKSSRNKIN